jgi:hypothetical protein
MDILYSDTQSKGDYTTLTPLKEGAAMERQTAQYIADMILELRNLAKGHDLETLQGLLEISYYEAYGVANRVEVPANELEHLQNIEKDAKRFTAA